MVKHYYTIGEVCNLLDLKPHVLRYWEKEFLQLRPRKSQNRNRRYTPDDIDVVRKIKFMLYDQKFTIDGAKKRFKASRKNESKEQIQISFVEEDFDKKNKIINDLKRVRDTISQLLK